MQLHSRPTDPLSVGLPWPPPHSQGVLPFILSYINLSYLILSYLILSYPILSYLILSYLILSYLILSYLLANFTNQAEAGGGSGLLIGLANVSDCNGHRNSVNCSYRNSAYCNDQNSDNCNNQNSANVGNCNQNI